MYEHILKSRKDFESFLRLYVLFVGSHGRPPLTVVTWFSDLRANIVDQVYSTSTGFFPLLLTSASNLRRRKMFSFSRTSPTTSYECKVRKPMNESLPYISHTNSFKDWRKLVSIFALLKICLWKNKLYVRLNLNYFFSIFKICNCFFWKTSLIRWGKVATCKNNETFICLVNYINLFIG